MRAKTGHEIEWWFAAACQHAEADETCGRPWQCACGPCPRELVRKADSRRTTTS